LEIIEYWGAGRFLAAYPARERVAVFAALLLKEARIENQDLTAERLSPLF
jgi:hypothetical protein